MASLPNWPVIVTGNSGANVSALQCLLNYRNNKTLTVDGSFGTNTYNALVAYQKANNLSADGKAGSGTLSKLIAGLNIQNPTTSMAARAAQYLLNKFGAGLTIDGAFGSGSQTAAKNFQSKMGISSTGVINANTWQYLFGYNSYPDGGGTVSGWLKLHSSASSSGGRTVNMPSEIVASKWAMTEGDPYKGKINPYAGNATVIKGSSGELVDGNGRYWVAVGPNVMNPNHSKSKAITAEEMKYQSKIDIVLKNASGTIYYVYAAVGDCKAHTYPTGIIQTGNAFPNGTDPHPGNADGSVVEFMGTQSISGLRNYDIVKIIVY